MQDNILIFSQRGRGLNRSSLLFAVLFWAFLAQVQAQTPGAGSEAGAAWKLVWSDEFNYTGLPDSTKWGFDTGGNGWGNKELEYYTKADTSNAVVRDGFLWLTARKEAKGGNQYTSARLVTKGKGHWLYGRIEVRAKLPAGRGLWPAIWMLSTDWNYGGWPASGEIDIMENVGFMPDSVFGSVHTKKFNHVIHTGFTKGLYIENPAANFHIYTIEWSPAQVRFFVDDQAYSSFSNSGKGFEEWPFDRRFHLLLNVAVGGGWGGAKGVDDAVFPRSMQIDYVRVYQNPTSPGTRIACLPIKQYGHRYKKRAAEPFAVAVVVSAADHVMLAMHRLPAAAAWSRASQTANSAATGGDDQYPAAGQYFR